MMNRIASRLSSRGTSCHRAGLELFLPLVTGAAVVIATREMTVDGREIAREIESRGITVMQATPATSRLLIDSGWAGCTRLKALCGGEAWPPDLAGLLLPRVASLWNMYGPTETTIWSSVHKVGPEDDPIPIGPPIGNTTFYILDAGLQPVPIGDLLDRAPVARSRRGRSAYPTEMVR
jgi:non-ribosomal peptide synthetase component F